MRLKSQTNIWPNDLAIEALESVRAEKFEKACNVIRDHLQVSLTADQITEILKEKDIE